jgi:uncharacterized protein with von Willebrand factor type A (vWA) domain
MQRPDPAVRGLQPRVLDFAHALRRAGVPVAVSDNLDALRATTAVDLLDRPQLREALAATMTTSPAHRAAFDTLFDVFFPARSVPAGEEADAEPDPRDIGEFIRDLLDEIRAGDDAAIARLGQEAVASYGRVANRDGTASYFSYRVFRELNLAGLLRRLLQEGGYEDESLAQRLARDEFDLRLRRFREEVDAEIRRRLVADRGAEEVARRLVRPLPEDVDFFRVTADEQAEMRRAVRQLARKLAARLAVKRRSARDGRLDMRATIRHSLSTGGAPANPVFRARKVHRPELVLLCDISGSVAAFARFTLLFCHTLQGQFARVRSFAFVDAVDEVTRLFEEGDFNDALRRLSAEASVVWIDGHSDYGHAFESFHAGWADAITPKTTLLVLGDARNNYRAANGWALADLRRRARRVYWLNPEGRASWGTGDSIAAEYARHTDEMVECRTLRQLSAFIERIA